MVVTGFFAQCRYSAIMHMAEFSRKNLFTQALFLWYLMYLISSTELGVIPGILRLEINYYKLLLSCYFAVFSFYDTNLNCKQKQENNILGLIAALLFCVHLAVVDEYVVVLVA